ncbi:hypothetical protein BY458DRAFT_542803 [Sporodiniella umbellata]|nr:hypothetical protein BY458DRAFT_542803 [Sporodiniella umbellata]
MRTSAIAVACIATFLTADVAAITCSKHYIAKSSDKSCSVLSRHAGVSSSDLHKLNTNLNSRCSNVVAGQKLCVKSKSLNIKKAAKKATTKKTKAKKSTVKKTTVKKTSAKKITTKSSKKQKTTTTVKEATQTGAKKTTVTKKTTVIPTTATTTTRSPVKTTTTAVATSTPNYNYVYGLTAQITSGKDFCLFLPPSPGNKQANGGKIDNDAIANSEKNARAFCTQPNAKAPGALTLPVTFITTANFYTDEAAGYTQVTGRFNPSAWELSNTDEGGQYDNHGKGSPPKSMCHGYKYYVNMIEPNDGTYCMRCCNSYADCNAGRSAYGCKRIVSNGIY